MKYLLGFSNVLGTVKGEVVALLEIRKKATSNAFVYSVIKQLKQ